MTSDTILPDDEPPSMPSMPTQRGDGGSALGRVDHYELLRKLGGGGFGVVYLARDTVGGIEVALKTLHPLLKHNAEEMELLRERFALVSRLSHPNIATALVLHPCREVDVWDEGARRELKLSPGDRVMVMRYAPGATLSKWRRQFPDDLVPFELALEVGRQVAAALDYAHSERIVHRDIKPGNIMVETIAAEPRPLDPGQGAARSSSAPTLRVRILDFGLAAEIRSSMSRVSTEQGDTSGTRPYMAPEQWLGRKQDGRTDQYALACVLYELLSGAPPFAGVFETGDPVIMRTAVLSDPPAGIEDLAPSANAALLRALAKEPKDRFPNCAALMEAIASTASPAEDTEDGPEPAPRPSAPRPEGAATRRVAVEGAARGPARYQAREEEPPPEVPEEPGVEETDVEEPEGDRPAGEALSVPFRGRTIVLRRCPAKGSRPAFWLAETPVAGWLWKAVTGSDPSRTKGDTLPVTDVSWNDCNDFLERLNAVEEIRRRGLRFRLPTAEEWRFACRAESCGDYCRLANGRIIVPRTLQEVAWYKRNSGGRKRPVGTKKPNAWGLRDMHGNVWEWTSTPVGGSRTLVGGSALEAAAECSASAESRRWAAPDQSFDDAGLRLLAVRVGEKPSVRWRKAGNGRSSPSAASETEHIPTGKCPSCGTESDVSGLPPFATIACPSCGAEMYVPAKSAHFLPLRRLGSGGMWTTFLAKDESLGREVAVKVMQKSLGEEEKAFETFKNEAQNAARLHHPHVAQIYSFGLEKGIPYLEMELVPGGDLGSFVANGTTLDPAFVLRVGLEIAEGLKAAAEVGLFHGDVKPDNILFDESMSAKLVGFGLASLSLQGKSDEPWCTPYYIAPEKVQKKMNSARSDIYSLGATLYHAITGKPPYDGADPVEVIKARFKGPPPPIESVRPDVEPEVARIISRMMNYDLFVRYPNYNSLIGDLNKYLGGVSAFRKQGPKPAKREARKEIGGVSALRKQEPKPAEREARKEIGLFDRLRHFFGRS